MPAPSESMRSRRFISIPNCRLRKDLRLSFANCNILSSCMSVSWAPSCIRLRSYLEFPHVAHKMSLLEDDLHLLIHMLDAAYDGECMFVGFRNEDMRMKVINGVCSKEFQVRVLF
ncbi:hypothetical protein L1987_10219 [Smallanthus sonchifolius]|uniref:Uncharacterized protein n=1 Tax=Smallanthus sonchifolius TaxID=185202 RepID=A0ACB9JRF9_9ASTR|nr:hypothetical protein L1987_10219 [Smallanthus sonchifolius]